LRIGVDGIERGHDEAGIDVLAFLDEHFLDLAGDLGRHRRLASRGDVAGGIEHRRIAAGAADRGRSGDVHLR
jgi:hypothetical protein